MKQLVNFVILICGFHSCQEVPARNEASQSQQIIAVNIVDSVQLASGRLMRIDSFPSDYITPRPVDIWLPESYATNKKYAVLYMHDGQMLFDSTTTWNKQEWQVDETASRLIDNNRVKDFMVVAIHNISDIRWQDLFPEKAFSYIEDDVRSSLKSSSNSVNFQFNGDNYLNFITEELKPFIDGEFSTLSDRENTFIAGSSMGGLMSMYAISEYPEIFGGAACISTHWVGGMPTDDNPFPKAIFQYMAEHIPDPENHKLYFDYGNRTLDQHYPQYASVVDSIMKHKGYDHHNYRNLFFEGTDHSERSWQKRLDVPLVFLLGTNQL